MLQDLLRNHQLVALNTWSKGGLRASTYWPAARKGHSQIDFAIARASQCDQVSRQTRALHLPFVPSTGMRHIPICGSLPKPVTPKTPRSTSNLQKRRVLDTCRQQPQVLANFQEQVAALVAVSPDMHIATAIEQSWKMVTQHTTRTTALPASPHQSAVTTLWRQRKLVSSLAAQLAHLRSTGSQGYFHVIHDLWREYQSMKQLQNTLRDQCRRRKRERINRLLEEAACKPHSLPHIFQLLRTIAPKTPHRRLQFKADNGMPLSNKDALQAIHQYFYDLYNKIPNGSLDDFPKPTEPFQVTSAELATALAALPASKALPSHLPPAVLWKAAATTAADSSLATLNHWLANMEEPPRSNGI